MLSDGIGVEKYRQTKRSEIRAVEEESGERDGMRSG
jgi:hypothetical protein